MSWLVWVSCIYNSGNGGSSRKIFTESRPQGRTLVVDLDSPEPDHRLHRASSWEAPLLSWFDSSYMSIFTDYRLRST